MLLLQNLCNVVLYCSELLVHVMQELLQVCTIKLAALNQYLLDKRWSGIVEDQEEESEGTLSGIHGKLDITPRLFCLLVPQKILLTLFKQRHAHKHTRV